MPSAIQSAVLDRGSGLECSHLGHGRRNASNDEMVRLLKANSSICERTYGRSACIKCPTVKVRGGVQVRVVSCDIGEILASQGTIGELKLDKARLVCEPAFRHAGFPRNRSHLFLFKAASLLLPAKRRGSIHPASHPWGMAACPSLRAVNSERTASRVAVAIGCVRTHGAVYVHHVSQHSLKLCVARCQSQEN